MSTWYGPPREGGDQWQSTTITTTVAFAVKQCVACGKDFTPRGSQKYCGDTCRRRAAEERRHAQVLEQINGVKFAGLPEVERLRVRKRTLLGIVAEILSKTGASDAELVALDTLMDPTATKGGGA